MLLRLRCLHLALLEVRLRGELRSLLFHALLRLRLLLNVLLRLRLLLNALLHVLLRLWLEAGLLRLFRRARLLCDGP